MALSGAAFEYVCRFVRMEAGLVLDTGKEYLVENRLLPLARQEGLDTADALVTALRGGRSKELHRRVVEAMTTNETSFFRDAHPFDALKKVLLPELAQRRAREKTLSIWCAAASTGQEPYSIAMLLEESGLFRDWRVELVATDLSTEVLSRAREGVFSQLEVDRGLPAALLAKYFERAGLEWRVNERVRRLIQFRELNLAQAWPRLPTCDLVFVRNVLIYFDVPTKRAILDKVRGLLRPDGYLFLGGSETTLNIHDGYERVAIERAGCYRRRGG